MRILLVKRSQQTENTAGSTLPSDAALNVAPISIFEFHT
jgi:hypothetical protein